MYFTIHSRQPSIPSPLSPHRFTPLTPPPQLQHMAKNVIGRAPVSQETQVKLMCIIYLGICNKLLDSTTFAEHDGKVFCKGCHSKKFGPKGYGFGGGAGALSTETGAQFGETEGEMTYVVCCYFYWLILNSFIQKKNHQFAWMTSLIVRNCRLFSAWFKRFRFSATLCVAFRTFTPFTLKLTDIFISSSFCWLVCITTVIIAIVLFHKCRWVFAAALNRFKPPPPSYLLLTVPKRCFFCSLF